MYTGVYWLFRDGRSRFHERNSEMGIIDAVGNQRRSLSDSCPPAIRRRNGSLIETWEDLKGMGFEVRACTCHILFELVSVASRFIEHPDGSAPFKQLRLQLQGDGDQTASRVQGKRQSLVE